MVEITTVKVTKATRRLLAELGAREDTHDDGIKRLIDFYLKKNKKVSLG